MLLLTLLAIAAFFAELFTLRLAPRRLSRLARFPVGDPRTIPLSDAARRALIDESVALDYRTSPERYIDLARLQDVPIVDTDRCVLTFLGNDEAMARRPFGGRVARPLLFVRMRAEGDRIVLTGRFWPPYLFSTIALWALIVVASGSPPLALLSCVVFLLPYSVIRGAARELLDAVEDEVTIRVLRLAPASIGAARVAADSIKGSAGGGGAGPRGQERRLEADGEELASGDDVAVGEKRT